MAMVLVMLFGMTAGVTPVLAVDTIHAAQGFYFDGIDGITGYDGAATDLVIPCSINGVTVTSISGSAYFRAIQESHL